MPAGLGRVIARAGHVAVPVSFEKGDVIEGEAEPEEIEGPEFPCFLMLPGSGDANEPVRRRVTQPSVMYEPFDAFGDPLAVGAEDRLRITAVELTGPDPVEWVVDGDPEPLAPPGDVIGYDAALRRVEP